MQTGEFRSQDKILPDGDGWRCVCTTRACIRLPVAILLLLTSGCLLLNPDVAAITAARRQVRLISDSPDVAASSHSKKRASHWKGPKSIASRRKPPGSHKNGTVKQPKRPRQLRELGQHPEHYIPERTKFLDAMAQAPSVLVPGESYCRIITRSNAMCDRHPEHNPTYFKVRITSGPSKGQESWGCVGEDIRFNGLPL